MVMPRKSWPPPRRPRVLRFHSPKINHDGFKSPPQLSRTEFFKSERRGSVDVAPFKFTFRISAPAPRTRTGASGARIAWSAGTLRKQLHHRSRRKAGAAWARGGLDRDRHGDGAWRVVGRDRHLFRIPR